MTRLDSVKDYLQSFSQEEVRERLLKLQEIVQEEAPEAVESLSYGLVGYKYLDQPLVYFGGFAKHIGFYATPGAHAEFIDELSKYKQGKGSVQFPLDRPLPVDLIRRMVRFKKQEIGG